MIMVLLGNGDDSDGVVVCRIIGVEADESIERMSETESGNEILNTLFEKMSLSFRSD